MANKSLIITEKPSVARDFARVLGVNGNQKGFIENDTYVISWCYGHLVEMAYPEVYDEKYKKWKLEDLPFLPADYKYGVVESAKDQYKIVNSLLHREDIDTVYWAGDSGKEGQTIEENIRNYGGVRQGMRELRVWIDSQTDEEIRRGINEARPMSDYALLGKSGIMRTIEDYSLGINFSRALSVKYGKMINDAAATSSYTAIAIGRVMTCVLGMVVNREREIRNFVETPFYRVVGSFSDAGFNAEWKAVQGSKYFESPLLYKENGFKKEESAKALIDELTGKRAVIDKIENGKTTKRAPLLFNLAELQSECSKIFKISPAQALDVAQELYEKKLTTYPRTDARVLTTAVAKEITKNLRGLQNFEEQAANVKHVLENGLYKGIEKSSYTDDSKVTDHYAIIPTGQTSAIGSLSPLSKSVYSLICKRFLSIFFPPAEYKTVKVQIGIEGEKFFASAKMLTKPGYLAVAGIPAPKNDGENADGDEVMSKEEFMAFVDAAKEGDEILVKALEIKEGKTSPPKRYTSGNLILAMENAGNLIEDEELREQIKKSGIGTSATRGEIIDKLVRIKYLNQNNKTQIISPEKLGEMIYEVVNLSVPSLLNPEMTASWEKGLEGIVNGSVDFGQYRSKLEDYIRRETNKMINVDLTGNIAANINQFTGKNAKGIAARKSLGLKCPVCGGELTTTPFGYGCSNYYTEGIKCTFSVGQVAGLDIPEEEFAKLITEGKTSVLDGFSSKSKTKFKAALVLNKDESGKVGVSFDFSEVPTEYVEGVTCPACGGRLVKTGYGVSCENRSKIGDSSDVNRVFNSETSDSSGTGGGCYFSIGEIAGKKLDEGTIRALLTEGKTDVIKGFKSKNKKSFDAKLELKQGEDGKYAITFDFEGIEPDYLKDVVCPNCGGRIMKKSIGFGCENFKADDSESCKFFIGKIAQKQLTEANVVELLKEGRTKTIRGFKSKEKKSFDACLILKKNEEGKSEVSFDFENVEAKTVKDVVCPVCGGEIVKTPFGYGCKNYKKDDPEHSCKFNIGQIAGVKLKDAQVKELLTDGITSMISGFKSKTGKKFDAKLSLGKDEEGNVTGIRFVFESEDELMEGLKCPKCGSSIIKGHFGYRCASYKKSSSGDGPEQNAEETNSQEVNVNPENSQTSEIDTANENTDKNGCKFFVGKIAGVELTKEQFTKLITDKETDKIAGFMSKKGTTFEAKLKFDENFNVVFNFD